MKNKTYIQEIRPVKIHILYLFVWGLVLLDLINAEIYPMKVKRGS